MGSSYLPIDGRIHLPIHIRATVFISPSQPAIASTVMASTTTSDDAKPGSLIIAGSGIASVAHITLETISYLKAAHIVFYLVSDPITDAFIKQNNSNAFDLAVFYGKSKDRRRTYVEMAEVSLNPTVPQENIN